VSQSQPHLPPDAATIEAIARDAWTALPEQFRAHLGAVLFRVEDFADDDVLEELGIDSPYELTGLYTGRPVGQKSVELSGALPDMIRLYRVPILCEWVESGEELGHLVRHVLIHEVGHHFGLSDDDMHAIEDAV
jgi:predicted Zn-dependent protease with MMP-like domain